MEKTELINSLERIKNEIHYNLRIKANGTKKDKSVADEELKNLSVEAIKIFKENNILDLTRPNRNKENDFEWYKDLFGKGGADDISFAIINLKGKIN